MGNDMETTLDRIKPGDEMRAPPLSPACCAALMRHANKLVAGG